MSNLIDKWNAVKNQPKYEDKNETVFIRYRDKNSVHKKSLIKLAKYFRIGERKLQTANKLKYSLSNVARDIIEEYLNRDDIKKILEQIDKENK